MTMKSYHRWLVAAATSLPLFGCSSPNSQPNHTAGGALLGGAIGAGAGALAGGSRHAAGGALIGGAVGALTGGLIGQSIDQEQRQQLQTSAPATYQRVVAGQPLEIHDIEQLVHAGVSDDLIISDIRSSHTVYQLSTADIIDLKKAGVSERVIDVMIDSPNAVVATTPPPPPPQQEVVVAAPGPDYAWVGGSWIWVDGGWV
jgi:surface antigen